MCNCYFCDQGNQHPGSHNRWIVVSPIDNVPAVSCYTCGHVELYDPDKHRNLSDIG